MIRSFPASNMFMISWVRRGIVVISNVTRLDRIGIALPSLCN